MIDNAIEQGLDELIKSNAVQATIDILVKRIYGDLFGLITARLRNNVEDKLNDIIRIKIESIISAILNEEITPEIEPYFSSQFDDREELRMKLWNSYSSGITREIVSKLLEENKILSEKIKEIC